MSNILALDFGEKHIGVAVRIEKNPPQTLVTITFTNTFELKKHLLQLFDEYNIQTVVLGKTQDTTPVNTLKGLIHSEQREIKVTIVDESFTTTQAQKDLAESKTPTRVRSKTDHAVAAELLLHQYLETQSE